MHGTPSIPLSQHTKDPSRKTQRQTTETSFFSQAFRFEYLLSSLEQRFQKLGLYIITTLLLWKLSKGRPGAVVRAVSLSHQIVGSKQPLRRFAGGRLASFFPFPKPHSCGSLWHWVCPCCGNCPTNACMHLCDRVLKHLCCLTSTVSCSA